MEKKNKQHVAYWNWWGHFWHLCSLHQWMLNPLDIFPHTVNKEERHPKDNIWCWSKSTKEVDRRQRVGKPWGKCDNFRRSTRARASSLIFEIAQELQDQFQSTSWLKLYKKQVPLLSRQASISLLSCDIAVLYISCWTQDKLFSFYAVQSCSDQQQARRFWKRKLTLTQRGTDNVGVKPWEVVEIQQSLSKSHKFLKQPNSVIQSRSPH
jgi:hypothetical protein